MPILLKRKNGEITPFRNAEYISAFYFIPKSILDKCGEEINSIPRNPRKLLQDRRAIEIIESDLFKLVIIDAYAFMVWPFMGLGAKKEIYSGYEPSWRYAHAASIWIKGMEDEGVIPKSQEILKGSNVDEDLGYISVSYTHLCNSVHPCYPLNLKLITQFFCDQLCIIFYRQSAINLDNRAGY